MNDISSAAAEISKKQESLHHAKQKPVTTTNRDLLSEITDNFHTEHGAHRAAVETRYTGGSALNPKLEGDDPATPKGAVPDEDALDDYVEEERRTGQRRSAPAVDTAKFTAAAADLYKKHETLRTTTAPVEPKGGNKDLLSEITDTFLKEHMAERAAVDTKYVEPEEAPGGPPAIGRVSAGLTRKSAAPLVTASAPAGPPRINRNSMGAVENKDMANAASALAAKHEALRNDIAKPSRQGGPSHDLLSEVTDQFMKDHVVHRAAVDTQNMATTPAPTFTPTPQAGANTANAIRRASMGSVPLVTVPEKKSKDGFMKKLGRLFSGEPSPKMKPKLQAQSMHVISAVNDIGEKSRQLTRTSVTSAGSGSATPSTTAPPKSAGSGADMLGTLCDEWHNHNASLGAPAGASSGYAPSQMPASKMQSQAHAQLEY